jgi:hypothetical protein
MREAVILRGDERRCREYWRKTMSKTPFFDDIDKAVAFLRRERLSRVAVYTRDLGREPALVGLGYFLRTELVP